MPTSTNPSDSAVPPVGATGSQPERDPQQEAVKTPDGAAFLHAGSGNSLGSGLTAGSQANSASGDSLGDGNPEDECAGKGGSASGDGGPRAQP